MAENEKEEKQPIIIKKVIAGGHGHHGGAWKVAYADFVTAMMAFFLLMWLLNVTTAEEKNAISSYFDPSHPKISDDRSGSGGVLGGLSVASEGSLSSTVSPFAPPSVPAPPTSQVEGSDADLGELGEETAEGESDKTQEEIELEELQEQVEQLQRIEEREFENLKQKIEKAILENPEIQKLAENLLIDTTPEGLRIQLIDQQNTSMFASGSSKMFARTRRLLEEVTESILDLPNKVSIRGHTDAVPFRGRRDYSNWELSSDRANSSRRIMLGAGLPLERIKNVVGKAATEPLIEDNPKAPQNRRISIILIREASLERLKEINEKRGISNFERDRARQRQNSIIDFNQ